MNKTVVIYVSIAFQNHITCKNQSKMSKPRKKATKSTFFFPRDFREKSFEIFYKGQNCRVLHVLPYNMAMESYRFVEHACVFHFEK